MLQHWCMTVQLATQFCKQTEELAPHINFIFNPNNVSNHQQTGKGCHVLAFMHQFCTLQNKRLKSLVIGNKKKIKNKATCTCDTTKDWNKTFVNCNCTTSALLLFITLNFYVYCMLNHLTTNIQYAFVLFLSLSLTTFIPWTICFDAFEDEDFDVLFFLISGFTSCSLTNPIWFVKTRLQLDQK